MHEMMGFFAGDLEVSDDAMAATMHCKNLVSESAILAIPSFVLLCLVALKEEAGDATQEEEKRDLCLCFFTLQNEGV
jgi:hypothetical protein